MAVHLKETKELRTICEEILQGKEFPLSADPSVRCVTDASDCQLMTPYGDENGIVYHYPNDHIFVNIERTSHSCYSPVSFDNAYCGRGEFGDPCDGKACRDCRIRWTISLGHKDSYESFQVESPLPSTEVITSPHPDAAELTGVVEAIQAFATEHGVQTVEPVEVDDATRLLNATFEDKKILDVMNSGRVADAFDDLPEVGKWLVLDKLLKDLGVIDE